MIQNQTLHKMLMRLQKFYWSPYPPASYTIMLNGRQAGVGIIAHKNYGAFNAAWALGYDLKTLAGQTKTLEYWHTLAIQSSQSAEGGSLESWLTLLDKESFNDWYAIHKFKFPKETRANLDRLRENDTGDVQHF